MRIAIGIQSILRFKCYLMSCRVINRIESGEYRVTALQFPALLYQEGSYDPDNLLNGLFRGHFLIRVSFVSLAD
jgi:hypothetical protein